MKSSQDKKFSFISDTLREDTFGVVKFTGTEGLSRLYDFEILLASQRLDIPLEDVIAKNARLIIHRDSGDDAVFQGLPVEFEQLQAADGLGFYSVRLRPKLWRLSLIRNNQIILDQALPDFLTEILKDGEMTALDFEFRLQGSYQPREYVCQYGESHLDFVSRWLEREGIYFFFEQGNNGEKVIFTDTMVAHQDLPQGKNLSYSPASGLETGHRGEIIRHIACRRRIAPGKVFVKEYNEQKPSLNVSGSAEVSKKGQGQVYYYHENFQTPEEGNRLAKIRAEAMLCREKELRGESYVPYLSPGFTFSLQDHFRDDYNSGYLITEVRHAGNQAGYLTAGLNEKLSDSERESFYRNEFNAIPSDMQFRPEMRTPRPRISGTISAHIDAAGSGKYAELDDQGRYHIVLPFDLAGRPDGKASAWVRMASPYVGADHGMHFPLHKGTEVLLTFIDGDPDRPVIAAAVPNTDNPSVVGSGNAAQSGFSTAGGSSIHADDTEGNESLVMRAGGDGKSGIMMVNDSTAPLGSGLSTMTNWQVNATSGSLAATAAGVGAELAMFQKASLTGFLPVQAACTTVGDVLIKQALPLYAKTKQEASGATPSSTAKASVFSTVMAIISPILAFVSAALPSLLITSWMKKTIANKNLQNQAQRWGEIINNSGYQVACGNIPGKVAGSGVVVQQGWYKGDATDKSITMVSGNGPIMTYSDQDTHIVAGQNVTIASLGERNPGGGSIGISGANDILVASQTGNIDLAVQGQKQGSMNNTTGGTYFVVNADAAEMAKRDQQHQGSVVRCGKTGVTMEKTDGASVAVNDDILLRHKDKKYALLIQKDAITIENGGKGLAQVADKRVFLSYGDSRLVLDNDGITMNWKGMGKLGRNMKIDAKTGKITMG